MATPGQLVECLAAALNLPVPTVVQYDRILAENGYRSKSGRGKSAAKVTSLDAANLLIAIAGSPASGPSVKEAMRTLEQFAELRAEKPLELPEMAHEPKLTFKDIPGLASLKRNHSFREGLAALIEAVCRRDIVFQRHDRDSDSRSDNAFVMLDGPWFRANISVRPSNKPVAASVTYKPRGSDIAWSDLSWRRSFTLRTISAVAATISDPKAPTARKRGRSV